MSEINKNYIGGEWLQGSSEIENRNPSDLSDLIGLYTQADADQVATALAAANEAQRLWGATGLEKRYDVLMAVGQEMMARSDELGRLLSREEGKPFAEGKGEVFRAGQFFTYFAAEVLRQIGDNADSVRDGIEVDVRREPVGVVAIISPWNFPTATAVWKIAPALAFGNAVVWKPANLVPASAVAFAEIMSRQDIPKGLFNLVMGAGGAVGQQLADSPLVNALSFTGSVPVGRQIASSCIVNFTKIQLEMGSKNALAVMDDADMDLAVACALNGAFGGTGQKCTASSRLVVHEAIHDEFVERLAAAARNMVVDHALKDGTQLGPVVSGTQLQENLQNIALAKSEGGEILCGGERVERDTEGYFMTPAVVAGTQNDWQVNREELFAPIACVIKVSSYEEALSVVNDTRFGLTSGIMTRSLSRASHFRRHAATGCVMVNLATAGTDYHVPFGGRGESSYGPREQGQYAKEFYTTVKTSYISSGAPE
ncbi:MAG: aldehyde dehydrogenase family protein [Gammaproteobacteria bacterium]|nr:aldehyde dehydrogenase family protein [Gammaproteobacteria bacterium]MBT7880212.1 aldehyde dehydrogenase family protein [Gammaproteobacteria bacterium]